MLTLLVIGMRESSTIFSCFTLCPYSLKRMAPTLRTKKKVDIIKLIMSVKLTTIRIWVMVIWVHQGASFSSRSRAASDEEPSCSSPTGLRVLEEAPNGLLALLEDVAKGLTAGLSPAERGVLPSAAAAAG